MQCKMEHDRCHNTRLFQLAGQNLFTLDSIDEKFVIENSTSAWFAEYAFNSLDNIRKMKDLEQNG